MQNEDEITYKKIARNRKTFMAFLIVNGFKLDSPVTDVLRIYVHEKTQKEILVQDLKAQGFKVWFKTEKIFLSSLKEQILKYVE